MEERMDRYRLHTAIALMGLLPLAVGCEHPSAPSITPAQPAQIDPSGVTDAFPPVPVSAEVYDRLAPPHSALGHASRYVFYDDGSYELQYLTERWGFFAYSGIRSEDSDVIVLRFHDGNTAGEWTAVGRLEDGRLEVEHNTVMLLADFEDGVYVLRSNE